MQLTQIAFQDPATNVYLHDPSIVRLESGDLLVSLNYHGPGSARSIEDQECLTSLYRSRDQGKSWSILTHINHCFAANLFKHRGAVYLLGMDRRFGSICIRRSDDSGNTWSRLAPEGRDPAKIVGSAEEALRTPSQRICAGRLFQGGPVEDPPITTVLLCRYWRAAAGSTGHSRTVPPRTGPESTPIPRSEDFRRL